MNRKIVKYELKKIVFSKMFIVTSIILLIFSSIDFYTSVILGISGTAPFSKWSYCKFLCDINSILLMMVMFFCTDFFSNQESKVKEITWFTPMPQRKVWIAKFTAIFISYLITVLCCILALDYLPTLLAKIRGKVMSTIKFFIITTKTNKIKDYLKINKFYDIISISV